MGSPLSGRSTVLLRIDTADFAVIIKGPAKNEIVEAFRLHQNEAGAPLKATLKVVPEATVQVFEPGRGLVPYDGGPVVPVFFEQTNYEFILEPKAGCTKNLRVEHLNKKLREAIGPVGSDNGLQSGVINFEDEVGFSQFEIWDEQERLLSFEVEVYPSKLDYQRDYHRLLQEVTEEVYNLAFGFLARTSIYAGVRKETEPTQAEFYAIFRVIRERLSQALDQLQTRPHHKIVSIDRIVAPDRVKRGRQKAVLWLAKRSHLFEREQGGLLAVNGGEFTPRKVPDARRELTYNTYENQFLKWMLQQLELKLYRFGENCHLYKVDQRVLTEVDRARNYLRRYSRHFFLQGVDKLRKIEHSSLVIQMAPGYRDVYRYYLMLLKGLNITSDIFAISLKGMAELYEYWCFLKLNALLGKKYQLQRHNLIAVDRTGLVFNLKKGQESTIEYVDPRNGERFSISYNRFFTELPTVSQKPDNVLQLEKKGSNNKYQYIFDAKYRISVDKEYVEKFNQAGPPEDTINAMHRYRDAIIHASPWRKREVFGAFVLFPHNDELAYAGKRGGKPSKFFESIQQVGIGALPFLPGQTNLVERLLDELILEGPDSAFERTVLQDGTMEYFTRDYKRNVLIGPLGSKEQLPICLQRNMYYTYLAGVRKYLSQLEYVAIYQSKRLFKDEAQQGIFYYGRIKDFTILPRKEIKEAPGGKRPDELAVRFEVESWQRRLFPIRPGNYGPQGPQRTSWELFNEAVVYPELHLTGSEIRLWRELKRFGECVAVQFPEEQIDEMHQMLSMEFPGLVIRDAGGGLFEVVAGDERKQFSFSDLNSSPGKVLRKIILMWQGNYLNISVRNGLPKRTRNGPQHR